MTRWMVRTLLALAGLAAAVLAPRLETPELAAEHIAPVQRPASVPGAPLTVLVDVSGSMSDRGKLDYARQAIRDLNARMGPLASPALVTYADRAQVLVAPGEVVDDAQLDRLLTSLSAKGSSNLYDGLRVADALTASDGQVLILTDGPANAGVVDPARFQQLIRSMSERSAVVNTVVLEPDASPVLTGLAAASGGWWWTPRHPRDLTMDLRQQLVLSGGVP